MGRLSLVMVAKRHFGTLYGLQTRETSWADVVAQVALPVVAAALVMWRDWRLPDPGLVAGVVATVSALLCSTAVFLFQVRVGLNAHRETVADLDCDLVDETFYSVMWAVVVGLALSLWIVAIKSIHRMSDPVWPTAVAVALGVHFVLVVVMILRRLHRAYDVLAARRDL